MLTLTEDLKEPRLQQITFMLESPTILTHFEKMLAHFEKKHSEANPPSPKQSSKGVAVLTLGGSSAHPNWGSRGTQTTADHLHAVKSKNSNAFTPEHSNTF